MSKQLTAAELFEIVKDVDRKLWPQGVIFRPIPLPHMHPWNRGFVEPLSEKDAVLMFTGHWIWWLNTIDVCVTTWAYDGDGEPGFGAKIAGDGWEEQFLRPTLIEALAAACKAVAVKGAER